MTDLDDALHSHQLVEELASIEHERWAHWQLYLHEQCEVLPDGSLRIPAELVDRWTRQARTDYAELADEEKDSDREQVLRYLPTLATALLQPDPAQAQTAPSDRT